MGRHSDYERARPIILASLRNFSTRLSAAASAGIDPATMWRWCRDKPEFAAECDVAEYGSFHAWEHELNKIMMDPAGDPAIKARLGPELLKRRHRQDYGDSITVDLDREFAALVAESQRLEKTGVPGAEALGDRGAEVPALPSDAGTDSCSAD